MRGSAPPDKKGGGQKDHLYSDFSKFLPTSISCRTEKGVRKPEVKFSSLRQPLTPQYGPDDPVESLCFLLRMAENFAQKENYLEAMKAAESALLLRKKNAEVIQEALRTNEALQEFHLPECITDQANNIVLLCNSYAVCAFSTKKFDVAAYFLSKALFLTDSAVEKIPGDLPYSINKAKAMYTIGGIDRERLPQEEEIATLCFVNDSGARLQQRAATFNNLGCMERRRRLLQESLDYFKRAAQIEVRLDPNGLGSPSTYLNICTILNEMQRYSEAVPAAERAIAALQMQLQEQSNASDICNLAIMLSVGQYNLGVSLEKRGKFGDEKAAAKAYEWSLDTARRYLVGENCPTAKAAMAALKHVGRVHLEVTNTGSKGISSSHVPINPLTSSKKSIPHPIAADGAISSTFPSFTSSPPSINTNGKEAATEKIHSFISPPSAVVVEKANLLPGINTSKKSSVLLVQPPPCAKFSSTSFPSDNAQSEPTGAIQKGSSAGNEPFKSSVEKKISAVDEKGRKGIGVKVASPLVVPISVTPEYVSGNQQGEPSSHSLFAGNLTKISGAAMGGNNGQPRRVSDMPLGFSPTAAPCALKPIALDLPATVSKASTVSSPVNVFPRVSDFQADNKEGESKFACVQDQPMAPEYGVPARTVDGIPVGEPHNTEGKRVVNGGVSAEAVVKAIPGCGFAGASSRHPSFYSNSLLLNENGFIVGDGVMSQEKRPSLPSKDNYIGSLFSSSPSSPLSHSKKNVFLQPPKTVGSGTVIPFSPLLEPIRKNSYGEPITHSGISLRDMPQLHPLQEEKRKSVFLPAVVGNLQGNGSTIVQGGGWNAKGVGGSNTTDPIVELAEGSHSSGQINDVTRSGKLSLPSASKSIIEEVAALRHSLSSSVTRSVAHSHSEGKKGEKGSNNSGSIDTHTLFGRQKFSIQRNSAQAARTSLTSTRSKGRDEIQNELLHRNQLHEKAKIATRKRKARETRAYDEELAAQMCESMVVGIREEQVRRFNNAALMIQRFWRGHLSRIYITTMIEAVRKLQPAVRRFLIKARAERRRLEEEHRRLQEEQERRELNACRFLQARVRQFIRRLQIRREFIARQRRNFFAARTIQRGYHQFCMRREESLLALAKAHQREEEQQRFCLMIAATHIQRAYRQYKVVQKGREAAAKWDRQNQAATTVQAIVRGVLTRAWFRYYRAYRRDRELHTAESIHRLTIVQAMLNGVISQRYMLERHAYIVKQLRDRRQFLAASKIQGLWRGNVARIHFERLKAENVRLHSRATYLQRWYRARMERKSFLLWREEKRRRVAATSIQKWIRGRWQHQKEKEFAEYHAALLKKQLLQRLQEESILRLQASLRARSSMGVVAEKRREYERIEAAGKVVQRIGRGYFGRKEAGIDKAIVKKLEEEEIELALRTASARVIQRAWRCAMARDRVEQLRREQYATLVIARSYRIYQAKKMLAELKQEKEAKKRLAAARLIQCHVRQHLRSLKYSQMASYYKEQEKKKRVRMRRAEAAVMIQSLWRRYRTRTAIAHELALLREMSQFAVVIQRAWRHRKGKVKVAQQVERRIVVSQAARTIQCFWRKMMAAERVARLREQRRQHISTAIRIQSWWRMVLAKRVLKSLQWTMEQRDRLAVIVSMKWEKAVTIINSFLRTRKDQLQLSKRERRYILAQVTDKERERFIRCRDAATKIQALYRGHYWRVMVRYLRKEKLEEAKRLEALKRSENRAATRIQCAYRQWRAQKDLAKRLCEKRLAVAEASEDFMASNNTADIVRELFWVHSAICRVTKSKESVQRHQEANQAALVIQGAYKKRKAKIEARKRGIEKKKEEAARTIQQVWRYHYKNVMQLRVEQESLAARRIQCHVRGWLVRRVFPEWQRAYEDVRLRCFQEDDKKDCAATILQSFWRRIKAERHAQVLRQDKGVAQQVISEAACIIQRAYRQHNRRRKNAEISSVTAEENAAIDHRVLHPPPTPPPRQRVKERRSKKVGKGGED